MTEHCKYIKARLKTYEQLVKVYPEAESWDKPIDSNRLFWYELFGLALSCWKLKFTM